MKWFFWFTPVSYMYDDYMVWQDGVSPLNRQEFGVTLNALFDGQLTAECDGFKRQSRRTIYCPRLGGKRRMYVGYRSIWHPDATIIQDNSVKGRRTAEAKAEWEEYIRQFGISLETNPRIPLRGLPPTDVARRLRRID